MNTGLTTIFKTALTLCVVTALKLNELLIFTAPPSFYKHLFNSQKLHS